MWRICLEQLGFCRRLPNVAFHRATKVCFLEEGIRTTALDSLLRTLSPSPNSKAICDGDLQQKKKSLLLRVKSFFGKAKRELSFNGHLLKEVLHLVSWRKVGRNYAGFLYACKEGIETRHIQQDQPLACLCLSGEQHLKRMYRL